MPRTSCFLALVLAGACLLSTAQNTGGTAGSDESAVRNVEDQITAALGRNDADALDRLWAPDYSFVNPGGQVFTKAQRLAALRSGDQKYEAYSRDDEKIRLYGNTAVVTYRSSVAGQKGGKEMTGQRRVITVLVKTDSGWQAVAQQSTLIMHP